MPRRNHTGATRKLWMQGKRTKQGMCMHLEADKMLELTWEAC